MLTSLQAMHIFTRVVETGSFTRAADSLAMPLATASRPMHDFKAHPGVKSLPRTTRTVSVAAQGGHHPQRQILGPAVHRGGQTGADPASVARTVLSVLRRFFAQSVPEFAGVH